MQMKQVDYKMRTKTNSFKKKIGPPSLLEIGCSRSRGWENFGILDIAGQRAWGFLKFRQFSWT